MTDAGATEIKKNDWAGCLAKFGGRPIYATNTWAAYKESQGWSSVRIAHTGPGLSQAAIGLVQQRAFSPLNIGVTLLQGGPLTAPDIDPDQLADILDGMLGAVRNARTVAEVVTPAQATSPVLTRSLEQLAFRPLERTDADTFIVDLSPPEESLRANLSKNWRHNLTRAEKRGLEVRFVEASQDARRRAMAALAEDYDALAERKQFAKSLDPMALFECFGEDPNFDILEIHGDGGLLATRVSYLGGDTTLDLIAASRPEARKTYANYLALWQLILKAKARGARWFDCGGIDETNNLGVFNFKKGLGAGRATSGTIWLRTRPRFLWPVVAKRIGQ